MKKYLRWAGYILAFPFILFTILCLLVYLPPVQHFAVRKATEIASEATGMQISIKRISLSFPLDLVVHHTQVINQQDTLLQAARLTVKVQLLPLLKKQIELDGLELSQAAVNTGKLVEGMEIKGTLGNLFVSSHGVALSPETAIINKLWLEDTHLSICLTDTTASDTTESAPLYWKIQLKDIGLKNVSFAMQMPLDSMDFSIALKEASLKEGLVDLHRSAYAAQRLRMEGNRIIFNTGAPAENSGGLNPSHLALNKIHLALDSVYYDPENMHAYLKDFTLKEQSGLEIVSSEGELVADANTLKVPELKVSTSDSYLELNASIDWSRTAAQKEKAIYGRLLADIGKKDLQKILGDSVTRFLPDQPLQIRAGVDGNLEQLKLSALSVTIPQIFKAHADGQMNYPLDSLQRNGDIRLQMETGNMDFMKKWITGIHIPSGIQLKGNAQMKGNALETGIQVMNRHRGSVSLDAQYDWERVVYQAAIHIDSLNLHDFIPQDSLYRLTANLSVAGEGMDVFSSRTKALLNGKLTQLEYGKQKIAGVEVLGGVENGKANLALNIRNAWIDLGTMLSGTISSQRISGELTADLKRMDLQAMKLSKPYLSPTFKIESSFSSDLHMRHELLVRIKDIALNTSKQQYQTKDIKAGVKITPDSLKSFVNSGDLTCWFKSGNSLEQFTQKLNRLTALAEKQWTRKQINHQRLRKVMPDTELGIYAGTDNPMANLLNANHIQFNNLSVKLSTHPLYGLNGGMNLFGLRTDSITLDTLTFRMQQDTASIRFLGTVKALSNKRQEGFDISLRGDFEQTEGDIQLAYLNAQKERGVDLGLKVNLRENGISLHVSPENPTLLYRTFHANSDNYVYLSDKGRVHAKLHLYDALHAGFSLYSSPDSLAVQDLTASVNRINIEEFQRIIPYMPDIAGFISAEAHYVQTSEQDMQVAAEVNIDKLAYNRQPMGDWGMSMAYLPQDNGVHRVDGFVTHNDQEIINLSGGYTAASRMNEQDNIQAQVQLANLPLELANAFIPEEMASLKGNLDGALDISGSSLAPSLNGQLRLDETEVKVPQASLVLKMDNKELNIKDNKLVFDQYHIYTKGKNPFVIDGNVELTDMKIDLRMNASNFEVLNAKKTKEALVFGKLYVDLLSTIKGSPEDLKMRGNINILGTSNVTYVLKDSPLTVEDRLNETVTFVNFNDTLAANADNLPALSLGGIDMLMTLHIDEAVQARVELNPDGSNYMLVEGGGDLSFQYQPDGNIVLNGRYSLTSGEMKYQLPIIPLKTFHIKEDSYIEWSGNAMNPKLNIKAVEQMRASVPNENGSSRMVNFEVGVSLSNRLEDLGFIFTLEAPNDGSMQNELASKSAEERNKLAVTMLVTGIYLSDNNASGKSNSSNTLNNYLQGQINKMAGKMAGSALKTIDINLGIETNEQENGNSSTDYNFQFAKRFWNNRIQIVIGGKISTGNDAQQQDNTFIDNISLEYRLDKSGTRYIKIFHDKNYESILDGEVIETGAGIVLRKKVSKLGELFIFRNRKKKQTEIQDEKQDDKDQHNEKK